MADSTPANFRIIKNGPKKYWLSLIRKLVKETEWEYSEEDYEINIETLDCTIYIAIEIATDTSAAIVSLTKVLLLNQVRPRVLSIIGCFFVAPEFRSRKIGLWLFNEMLKDATEDRFLVGVPSMWEKYRDRFGFRQIPGCSSDNCSVRWTELRPGNLSIDAKLNVSDWRQVEAAKLNAYDVRISACDRAAYLARTFAQPGSICRVGLNNKGKVVGFCRLRRMLNDHVDVGPFYADAESVASTLFRCCVEALLEGVGESGWCPNSDALIHFKIPSANPKAHRLLSKALGGAQYEVHSSKLQFTTEIFEVSYQLVYSRCESTDVTTA